MLITDDFVMLNYPKTGSSFARKVLKQVYAARAPLFHRLLAKTGLYSPGILELMMPKIDSIHHHGIPDQHGTYRQIPAIHRNKPVLSIARNPFLRYESAYHFRWWVRYPPADIEIIRQEYPGFPDLSFSEFYQMSERYGTADRLNGITPKIDLGAHSIQFIQFYFTDPEAVLRKIDDDYIDQQRFREDMGSVRFLHQEHLNEELKTFLVEVGFDYDELAVIDSMQKVNVSKRNDVDHDRKLLALQSPIRESILHRDKLLFSVFPEYLPEAWAD